MPSATLLPQDKTTIRMAIGHECQIFTATIVRLYLAYPDPNSWTYISTGAIAFMKDTRRNNAFFFRFVHLQTGSVVWEQEVYRDFKYYQEKPFFHTFFSDNCTVGFSFADENEALALYAKVQGRDNLRVQSKKNQPKSTASVSSAPASASSGSPSSSMVNLFGKRKEKKNSNPSKVDKSLIGAPSNFRHLTHVGYDPRTGFSTKNVPSEWKMVFEKAGVTEDQLQDANTAKFIFDFMNQNFDPANPSPSQAQAQDKPPPVSSPAPPAVKRTAPPPPPARVAPATPADKPGPPPPPARPVPPPVNSTPEATVPPAPPARSPEVVEVSPPGGSAAPPPPPPPPVLPIEETPKPFAARKPAPAPAGNDRTDLMASIRDAGLRSLKPASEREVAPKDTAAAPTNDIASALKAALLKRQDATQDESDEESDGDEW